MATTHAAGPDFSTPGTTEGQVRPDGRHKLASASTYTNAYFTITNSDTIASGTGSLKLEWYPEDKLEGGVWDVYLAASAATTWFKVGTITYGWRASSTTPTFSNTTSAKEGSDTLKRQYDIISVDNTTMAAVDGGNIQIKFVPRNNRGLVLTCCELSFAS